MGGGPRLLLLTFLAAGGVLGLGLLGEGRPPEGLRGFRGPDAAPTAHPSLALLPPAAPPPRDGRVAILPTDPAREGPGAREPDPPLAVRVEVRGPPGEVSRMEPFRVRIRREGGRFTPGTSCREIEVGAGETQEVRGLGAGRVEVTLVPGPGLALPSRGDSHPPPVTRRWPRPASVALPASTPVVLAVDIAARGSARIVVSYPEAARPGPGEVLLWPVGRAADATLRRRPIPAPRGGAREVSVPVTDAAGAYEVLLHVPAGTTGTGWTATGLVDLGAEAGNEVLLRACPACLVEGVVHDRAGRPVAGAEVRVALDAWRRGGAAEAPWEVEVDEAGRFRLGGLPPDRILRLGGTPWVLGGMPGAPHRVEVLQNP